jgi:hypothetical protein
LPVFTPPKLNANLGKMNIAIGTFFYGYYNTLTLVLYTTLFGSRLEPFLVPGKTPLGSM